jgi:serine/threonine protein kinase
VQKIAGKLFLFLEQVKGNTLAELIAWGRLDMEQALDYAIQVCEGMHFAHKKVGLVHRDLKPHNVLVTKDGTAKITDFGLTSVPESSCQHEIVFDDKRLTGVFITRLGAVAGTPPYMPPEQFLALKFTDTRSDIYSFGIMLYEMLTHHLPFSALDFDTYKRLHLDASPPEPPLTMSGVPSGIRAIIMKCLDKYPERRYQSFHDVKTDLVSEFGLMGQRYEAPVISTVSSSYDLALDGFLLLIVDDFNEADHCFAAALSLDECYPWGWLGAGLCKVKVGDIPGAMRCFDHALELCPELKSAQTAKAVLSSS